MTGKSKATDGALDALLERLDDAIDGMGHFPDHRDLDRRNGRMTERAGLFLNSIDTLLRDCRSSLATLPPPTGEPRLEDEWHEDHGDVVWWTWKGDEWLNEPSYIGSPLDTAWPGYHTHWTPHPASPAAPRQSGESGNG